MKQLIDEWESFRRRSEGIENIVTSLPPNNTDHIIKQEDAGLSISEDCFSQLWAGDSRLILDGYEEKALLIEKYRAGIKANIVSLIGNLITIGNFSLNPQHFNTAESTLIAPNTFDENIQLVIGPPNIEIGQSTILLGELLQQTNLMDEYTSIQEEDWSTILLKRLKNG